MLLFWTFRGWKIWSFWGKKLMERWYLLVTEKFLFWTFPLWRNTVIFEAKSKWKDDIYWLVKSSYFWATEKFLFWDFRWWEIRPFFSQKFYVKVRFTWVFELSMIFQDLGNTVFCAVLLLIAIKQFYCMGR